MFRRLAVMALVALFASTVMAQLIGTSDRAPATPARVPSTLALLNKRIPEVKMEEVPLKEVIEWLREFTGANVTVRWQVLTDAGVNADELITIKLKNSRLSQVLWMIMNEAGGRDLKLAYRAAGNDIILSTQEDLGKEMISKVYDLRDMLAGIARFEAPLMDPGQAMSQMSSGSGGGGGGGGGSSLFRGGQQQQRQGSAATTGDEGPEMRKILDIIQTTIEPDTWEKAGGKGTIHQFNGTIVVYNSPLVHQQIAGFVEEESSSSR